MILGKYTISIFRNTEIISEESTGYSWGIQISSKKAEYLTIKYLGIMYIRSGIQTRLGIVKRKRILLKMN